MKSNGRPNIGEVEIWCDILNVGEGDTKLSFDPKNEQDRARAAKIITEMIRSGFSVMVEVQVEGEKLYRRVSEFLPDTCEYVIFGDIDLKTPEAAADAKVEPEATRAGDGPGAEAQRDKAKPRRQRTIIPASSTRAVAIGRSAGG